MSIQFNELKKLPTIKHVVIHSLEQSLYQASVLVENAEEIIKESSGEFLRTRSLTDMRSRLSCLPIESATLRQQSAYDEMINQPLRLEENTMEIPFSLNTDHV